jgi:hypothetical protein
MNCIALDDVYLWGIESLYTWKILVPESYCSDLYSNMLPDMLPNILPNTLADTLVDTLVNTLVTTESSGIFQGVLM